MSETRVVHVEDEVPGAVYIGRAMPRRGLGGSLFANPFRIGSDGDRSEVLARYRVEMRFLCRESLDHRDALRELAGRPLACLCRHDGEPQTTATACHGDVLIEILHELGLETAGAVPQLATIHQLHDYAATRARAPRIAGQHVR